MARPLANLIFYCLEPDVGDGSLGWVLLDDYLKQAGVEKGKVSYPVFKYLVILEYVNE
jgi:hypothetical protein